MGILKILLYTLAFYYIFKFLARLFLPIMVKKVVEKAEKNFKQQQGYSNASASQKTNNGDEIIFENKKSTYPKESKKVGEYVDYEEID